MTVYWSDDEVEILRKAVAEGLSARECAARLHNRVSRNACIGQARRLGLSFRSDGPAAAAKRSAGQSQRMRQYWARQREIAAATAIKKEAAKRKAAIDLDAVRRFEPLGPENDFPDEASACRHITGDPGIGPWRCCGRPGTSRAFPYCEGHAKLLTTVPQRNTPTMKWAERVFR